MSEPWKRNLPVPFFSQRDNQYIWQRIAKPEGDTVNGVYYNAGQKIGQEYSLAWGSCNITSLCMILHYFGITNDTPDDMMRDFFPRYNYDKEAYNKVLKTGPDRLESAKHLQSFVIDKYKMPLTYIDITELSLDQIKTEISKGYPVWISFISVVQ